MKQDKLKKIITSGEQMEEKRQNIEKELLEEELFLDQEELDKMNEDKLDSDEEEFNKLIGKKYTRNEIEERTKAEIEEKEKNLPSAKKKLKKNRNFVVFLGKVINELSDNMFHVSLPSHKHRRVVLCYLSPRMRKNRIPILIGDTVKIHRKKNGFKKSIFFRFAPDKSSKNATPNQD